MQFHITAMDGTDENAPKRRTKAWQAHLDYVIERKAAGDFLLGGSIVGDNGSHIGSTLFVEVENRAALDHWLANDPFTIEKVWQIFDIKVVEIPSF
jgi:uncharacterized protein YciI